MIPPRTQVEGEGGTVSKEPFWWEDADGQVRDEDGKVDWCMPLKLDELGRVVTGWEHLF